MKHIQVVKIMQVREKVLKYETKTISDHKTAVEIIRMFLDGVDREHFGVLCLNAKNNVNAINTVSVGTVDQCMISQRECFKPAILSNSVSVIVFHNHPSGDPIPSSHDIQLTKRIIEGGKILGIAVHDHIIIAENGFYSFRETKQELF
ncbi:RadC family protein [Thermodesulfobacteriota bacterium]